MKIIEILSGLTLPITNEESELLEKFNESEFIRKSELSEREIVIVDSLINKEVLRRQRTDGKITYAKKIR